MCGLVGGINTTFSEENLKRLRHRGPDQLHFLVEEVDPSITVTFGQTRLNIVDRRDVALPIRLREATILFNGEIYNYRELREDLQSLGWAFGTQTDTEVALAAFLQWGPECLSRFNGMFALAVWDGRRFFCARDRVGKKPFFYRCRDRSFEFASEIKAFSGLELVDSDLLSLFEFLPNEQTLYRDVFQLPPGTYLVYDPWRLTLSTTRYWDIPRQVSERIRDADEAIETFIGLLTDSVKLRLRADVPITLFLSGGVDSSLLASIAGVPEAFTCQFTEFLDTINEERYAADLAMRLGLKVHVVRPSREDFFGDLSSLAWFLEMPTGSFSVFPLYRLAKACHEAGYKVVLSGEGSDELFAGYARNEFLLGEVRDELDPKVQSYRSMLDRYDGSALDRFCRMASRSGLGGAASLKQYLSHYWSESKSFAENICYIETRIFLQPLLQMADRMTMAHSVEARCPFLDYRMVEFAFALDDGLRYRDGTGKWLVHAAAKRLLPKESLVLQRRVKHGLPTPVNLWVQGSQSFDRRYWNSMMMAECMRVFQRT